MELLPVKQTILYMDLSSQVIILFILALPVACISWTLTHEKVFHELREYCVNKSKNCKTLLQRKFFYLFICEYCFSHYIAIIFLAITRYKLLFTDWRGYLIAGFALVWIANIYMSLYALMRTDLKGGKLSAEIKEEVIEDSKKNNNGETLKSYIDIK